jgi:hypothetical protein
VVDVCGGLALAHEPQRNDRRGEAQQRSERKHLVETCEESIAGCRWLVDGNAAGSPSLRAYAAS